jgi:hypothetical protein
MRSLLAPPRAAVDPTSRAPSFGSFRGPLPSIDWRPLGYGPLYRVTHHKRWVYAAIVSDAHYLAAAIVDLGYAMTCFLFAFDRALGKVVVDRSALAPALVVPGRVGDAAEVGCEARFSFAGTKATFTRERGEDYRLVVDAKGLAIDATLTTTGAPPPISVIAKVPRGVVNATEKRALMGVSGSATIDGKRVALDGATSGFDYTNGYLARSTEWKWAYLLGRAKTGERVGMNLVEGFVGDGECAVWVDDEVYGVGEGRFEHVERAPLEPWRVRSACGAIDLAFTPRGAHEERKEMLIVASKFIQPVGFYRGTIAIDGKRLELEDVLGVTEDQAVRW